MTSTNKNNEAKSAPSNLFNYLGAIVVIAGLVLFYTLKINIWLKWGIVLGSVAAGIAIFYFVSPTGLKLHTYVQDSLRELEKIVWPTRQDTTRFTLIIFAFVAILALFLWLVDGSLSWLFYNIILGRSS